MAVFGNLTEFPLVEVIGMLERRCGILRFSNLGSYRSLEFHMNNAQLQGLLVNGNVIRDGMQAKNLLLELANIRDGQFEFQRAPVNALINDLAIGMTQTLLQRATLDDEWHNFRESLPDPETRFTLATQELVWLDDDLQSFWFQAEPLLEYGINCNDLAQRLQLEPRMVLVSLYKLRAAGIIRPVRRMQEVSNPRLDIAAKPAIVQPVPTQHKPTLVSRLLGALRLIGKTS